MRRFMQSMLALALCVAIAGALGGLYVAAAFVATVIALSTGVYIVLAVGLGLVWPVLTLAWALHVTREASRRAAERTTGLAFTGRSEALVGAETLLPGIEKPK
jgi:hypothetical protein